MQWGHTSGCLLTTNQTQFDWQAVHNYLSGVAYWSKGIPLITMQRAFQNSLSFGLFDSLGQQIGAARMITDYATFAYMADVYVLDGFQGQGIGIWMIEKIINHPDLSGLRRYMLATSDAHTLYEKIGFSALSRPDMMMEIVHKDMYGEAGLYEGDE